MHEFRRWACWVLVTPGIDWEFWMSAASGLAREFFGRVSMGHRRRSAAD